MASGEMRHLASTMDRTLADAVRSYASEPLEFEPGTRILYSNPAMATIGRIIEVVVGRAVRAVCGTAHPAAAGDEGTRSSCRRRTSWTGSRWCTSIATGKLARLGGECAGRRSEGVSQRGDLPGSGVRAVFDGRGPGAVLRDDARPRRVERRAAAVAGGGGDACRTADGGDCRGTGRDLRVGISRWRGKW